MHICHLVVTVALVAGAHCLDRKRLSQIPLPDKYFDLKSWASGYWYTQARYVACSYAGSKEFSDHQMTSSIEGRVLKHHAVRRANGICTAAIYRLSFTNIYGVFKVKDQFGGMLSGDHITVVHNENKGYDIAWGCTKKDCASDKCDDPWVNFKTRERKPSQYVLDCVQNDLERLWGMRISEMTIMPQTNPC